MPLDKTHQILVATAAGGSYGTSMPTAAQVLATCGGVRTIPTNYASGTGTAGADNTAQVVKTIALAANSLTQVGDRIRVRSYWSGDTGTAITGTNKLNGVTIAATTDSGAATLQVTEAWLHYLDATHANIIAMAGGVLDTTISAVNVAGFDWANPQNITISQNQIGNNHIIVYFLAADIFPVGT
jgi:hypothetical protein